jgi:hypothetical protein
MREGAAFYCVSSGVYFLGAVGMINSLRLQGHDEPIYLLDCGLSPSQRELLAAEVTVIDAPQGVPPWLTKTVAPLRHPHEVMALIDSDMIVTRPLGDLLAAAAAGEVVAFENEMDRFEPRWGEVLDLGEVSRGAYLCSGFLAAGGEPGLGLLRLWDDRNGRVDFQRSFFADRDRDYPLLYLDQDVLNAIAWSGGFRERVRPLPYELAPMPPFAGLSVVDELALEVSYERGDPPFLVHHFMVKPWLERTHDGVYSRLLRRALVGPGLAIEVPPDEIPRRLRSGTLAAVQRAGINLSEQLRWRVGDPVRARLRPGRTGSS